MKTKAQRVFQALFAGAEIEIAGELHSIVDNHLVVRGGEVDANWHINTFMAECEQLDETQLLKLELEAFGAERSKR
jgi:hypothetical protein